MLTSSGFSQDLHYSQFYNSQMNVNPANTGLFNGDHRFVASLRDQWRFVPVPWTTFSGAYDSRMELTKDGKNLVGYGAVFNYDQQGDSKLNLSSLNLNVALHHLLSSRHVISGGIVLGFNSRGFNSQTLTWDKQWTGDVFNGNLPSGESFSNFERTNFLETGAGINYRYQKSSRTYVDAGAALLHLIKPKPSFYASEDIKLPRRFTLNGVGNVQLIDKLDVQVNALYQLQGQYNELVLSGLGKIYLSEKRGKEFQLHLGLGYRTAGSLFPIIAVQVNEIYASFSYDADNTLFNKTLGINRGGPEIHIRYTITNVKPLNTVKVCPIY